MNLISPLFLLVIFIAVPSLSELIFPRPGTYRYAFIIASSQGSLPSAPRDVVTHSTLWQRRGFNLAHYLDITPDQHKTVAQRLGDTFNEQDLKLLPTTLSTLASYKNPIDIVISISAHGYRQTSTLAGGDGYFNFGSKQITTSMLHRWFTPLQKTNIRTLLIVDACHAQALVGFNCDIEPQPQTSVYALAACRSTESDRDDISDEFGFGGGLTSCLADVLKTQSSFDLKATQEQCYMRMSRDHTHPQLCWM